MMKAVFFDACPTMLAKNGLPIAEIFKTKEPDFSAIFVSADAASQTDPEMERSSENKITKDNRYRLIHFKSFNRKHIEKFLRKEAPDLFFVDAFRIYDQLWISICHKLGIKVFSLQHGFEIDSVFYKPAAIISKYKKLMRFTVAAYNLARISDTSFLKLYYQYCRYIVKGTPLRQTLLANPDFQPTIAFVYSEYYKEFWQRKFGFDKNRMEIIMPTDLLLVKPVREQPQQDACCYITQTLVEDARMMRGDFLELLKSYREVAKSVKKFIIKLHPRVSPEIYEEIFGDLDNVEITRDFPNCKFYLTHYSSMAYAAAFVSNNVILHELPGHPTHELFRAVATSVVHSSKEIIDYIKSHEQDTDLAKIEDRVKALAYYTSYNDAEHPYDVMYKTVKKAVSRI